MRTLLALATVATLSLTGAAFAQSSTAPNGAPAGTGANTGTTPGAPNNNMGAGTMNRMDSTDEGRAAAPDVTAPNAAPDTTAPGTTAQPAPDTVRGDQNGQGVAK